MKKIIFLIVIIILGFSLYAIWLARNDVHSKTPEPLIIPLAMQNDSGETGRVTMSEVNGQVKVMVNLTSASVDQSQPAHIHRGSCATLGEVVYTLSQVVNGSSETTITAAFEALKSNLPLTINVHKSVAESGTYVACGDIIF